MSAMNPVTDRAVLSRLAFLVLTLLPLAAFADPLVDAEAWLLAQQASSGAFTASGDSATQRQSTLEVLGLMEAGAQKTAAQSYLASGNAAQLPTEFVAAAIVADQSGDVSPFLTEIESRQNLDGGFGITSGMPSTVADTAAALRALLLRASQSPAVDPTAGFLANRLANADGLAPYEVLSAWHALFPLRNAKVGYLPLLDATLAQFQAPLAEDFIEALRLRAKMLRSLSPADYQAALDTLVSHRNPDGSWNEDVFTTALVAQAMKQAQAGKVNPDLASITGRILDADYGTPLGQVELKLSGVVRAVTDVTGHFVIDNLSPGSVSLEISPNGYSAMNANIRLVESQDLDLGDVGFSPLVDATASILRGLVTDSASGRPLAGVHVSVDSAESAVTDASGQFVFLSLASGAHSLSLALIGYESQNAQISLQEGVTQLLALQMNPVGSGYFDAKGVVTDSASGQPLQGAMISVSGDASGSTITGPDGSWSLGALTTGSVLLTASAPGYSTASAPAQAENGQTLVFSPSLSNDGNPGASTTAIAGRVIDRSTGAFLSGAAVQVESPHGSWNAATDNDGRFSASMDAGLASLSVSLNGYRTAVVPVNVMESLTTDIGDVKLSPEDYFPSIVLSGSVLDSSTNAPLAAQIDVQYDNHIDTFSSDGNGSFSVSADGERPVYLAVRVDGHREYVAELVLRDESLDLGQIRLRPEELDELRPDLKPVAIVTTARDTDPNTLRTTGSISVEVENVGQREVGAPVHVLAFLDEDNDSAWSESDQEIGEALLTGLEAGQRVQLDIPVDAVLAFRDAPISVVLDPNNTLIELRDDNNVISSMDACRIRPERGSFEPTEKWRWQGAHVTSTPMVAPLQDTNGDGDVDDQDDPFVVFVAHADYFPDNRPGFVVAVNGRTGQEVWRYTSKTVHAASHVAIGDLDGDGRPEILALRYSTGLIALDGQGNLKWQSAYPNKYVTYQYGAPSIEDLDKDGSPEIIVAQHVLRADGSLWKTLTTESGRNYYKTHAVADLDLDNRPDIVFGGEAFDLDGNLLWDARGRWHNGIGNFNEDDYPEIVFVEAGLVRMVSHDGQLMWGPVRIGSRLGGAPTIGDVNGDGVPEIGVAGDRNYWILNADGSVRWSAPAWDSSGSTGSTFFDFDGDNRVEVVYMDERELRVFDGDTGQVLFSVPNVSVTAWEYPVVADIDDDEHAELLVPSYSTNGAVRAFEDADDTWVNARGIWNQFEYYRNNVNDDGSIPADAGNGWQLHNTYRVNSVPDPTRVADLTASVFALNDNGPGNPLTANLRVGNGGGRDASNVLVRVYTRNPADGGTLWAEATVSGVPAGGYVDVELQGTNLPTNPLALVAEVNSDGRIPECSGSNNSVSLPAVPSVGSVSVMSDASAYAPDAPVAFTAVAENTGSFARAFGLQVQAEDAGGNKVIEFAPQALGELASGEQRVIEVPWNTGRQLAGEYRVRARLYAVDGTLLDESVAPIVIAHNAASGPLAVLRLVTDRSRYHTTDKVRFELRAANESVSTLLSASSVHLSVSSPDGNVFTATLPVHELAAGNADSLVVLEALEDAVIGQYVATASWHDAGGNLLAVADRSFEVFEDLSVAVQGSVSLASPELYIGDVQGCTASAVNTGTQTANVNLRRSLVRLDAPFAESGAPFVVPLEPDALQMWMQDVPTANLAAGDYACVLEAELDGAWQSLANAWFRLQRPPIRIDAALDAGTRGRLLVLLDPACADAPDTTDCDAEPYGPEFAPSLPIQREHLEAVLSEAGWTYTIVTNAADFETRFRSQGYEVYALFNEVVKLPEALQDDVVADIAAGRGLLVAGNHDRRNGRLEDALGIKSLGKNLEVEALVVTPFEGQVGGELAFDVAHWPNAIRNDSADALANFRVPAKGKQAAILEPALTQNAHDKGTGLYAAFDWPAQSAVQGDDSDLAGLLTATLDVAHPDPYAPIAGRVVSLQLLLQNEGMATPGEAQLVLPPGVVMVTGPDNATVADGIVRWPFSLGEGEQQAVALWLRLAPLPGPASFEAIIYSGEGDSLTEHVRTQTVLNVLPQE